MLLEKNDRLSAFILMKDWGKKEGYALNKFLQKSIEKCRKALESDEIF